MPRLRESFNYVDLQAESTSMGTFEDPHLYYTQQGEFLLEAYSRKYGRGNGLYELNVRIRPGIKWGKSQVFGFSTRLVDMVVQCDESGNLVDLETKMRGIAAYQYDDTIKVTSGLSYLPTRLHPNLAKRYTHFFDKVDDSRFPKRIDWPETVRMYLTGRTPAGHMLNAETIFRHPLVPATTK